MNEAKKYIEQNYPNKLETKKIFIKEENLKGEINLKGFYNLEVLKVYSNLITNIDGLEDCPRIWNIYLEGNRLDNVEFLNKLPNPKNLTKLVLSNNNIQKSNLSIFSKFINLEGLFIGNSDKQRIKDGIYNRFYGTLEHLKLLTELESICIEATDINEGLEYLSKKVRTVHCRTHGFDKKVKVIKELLRIYEFSITKWRNSKEKLTLENKLIQQIEKKEDYDFPFLNC